MLFTPVVNQLLAFCNQDENLTNFLIIYQQSSILIHIQGHTRTA